MPKWGAGLLLRTRHHLRRMLLVTISNALTEIVSLNMTSIRIHLMAILFIVLEQANGDLTNSRIGIGDGIGDAANCYTIYLSQIFL